MFSLRVFVSQLWLSSRRVGKIAVPTSLKMSSWSDETIKDLSQECQHQQHDSLILRHRKTRDVSFFHFHDLVQVVSNSFLQKNHFSDETFPERLQIKSPAGGRSPQPYVSLVATKLHHKGFLLGQNSLHAWWIFSSVRSSSGYYGLIEIRSAAAAAPTFSDFSNSSDSKVKVKVKGPNMCYIFEKHGIQGYRIWHSRVSNVKYTNTRLHKYANTQIQSA